MSNMAKEKITVLIVDDDKKSQEVLAYHLGNIANIEIIGICSSADEAYQFLLERIPDLIFLDVEMPGKSGFDLMNDIRTLKINPGIIFQTAFDKYAIQAIKHAAFDYLLKPIDRNELLEALVKFRNSKNQHSLEQKVEELIAQIKPVEKIRFNTRAGFILIDPAEIIYCKADWNYTEIWLGKDKKELVTMNIGKVEGMLPPDHFCRVSRSLIINVKFIDRVDRKHRILLLVSDKERIELKIPAFYLKRVESLVK
jgi:two-component system LytT family response regulator